MCYTKCNASVILNSKDTILRHFRKLVNSLMKFGESVLSGLTNESHEVEDQMKLQDLVSKFKMKEGLAARLACLLLIWQYPISPKSHDHDQILHHCKTS